MPAGMKRVSGREDPANSITMYRENSAAECAVPPGPYAKFCRGDHAACPQCALVNVCRRRTRNIVCISCGHEITPAESYAFDISPCAHLIATEFRRQQAADAHEALAARRQLAARRSLTRAHDGALSTRQTIGTWAGTRLLGVFIITVRQARAAGLLRWRWRRRRWRRRGKETRRAAARRR